LAGTSSIVRQLWPLVHRFGAMLEGSAARFPTILAADGTLPGTSNEGSQFTKHRIRFAVMLLVRLRQSTRQARELQGLLGAPSVLLANGSGAVKASSEQPGRYNYPSHVPSAHRMEVALSGGPDSRLSPSGPPVESCTLQSICCSLQADVWHRRSNQYREIQRRH